MQFDGWQLAGGLIALWNAATRDPIGEFVEWTNNEVTGLLFRKNPKNGLLSQGEFREWVVDQQTWFDHACQTAGAT